MHQDRCWKASPGLRACIGVFLVSLAANVASAGFELPLEDQARIRAVSDAYCVAWLQKNPEEAVMRLFSEDAVLLPHHGVEPVVGEMAIRKFWFPKGSPPTTVTKLTHTIDEVGGSRDFGYIRGHSAVSWISGTGPDARTRSLSGTFLAVLRRQPDGSWRIAQFMWDDPPPREP